MVRQGLQVAALEAPTALEAVPAAQRMHAAPTAYAPAGHAGRHEDAPTPDTVGLAQGVQLDVEPDVG